MLANLETYAEVKKGDRIVFFGDSITQQGGKPKGYVTLVRKQIDKAFPEQGVEVINAGISGHKVPNLEKRLDRDVLNKKATIVVIYIGINDVWHSQKGRGTSKPDFESGLKRMIKQINEANAKVVLCTPSVIGEKTDGTNELDSMLEEYSAISRKVAKETNSQLLDLRQNFLAQLKKKNKKQKAKSVLTTDGVHLNGAGNQFVAQQMLSALGVKVKPKEQAQPTRSIVYKTVGDVELKLHVFESSNGPKTNRPAIVFFFGGGWNGGKPSQFYPHCDHLAQLGMVAMSAEYRVKSRNKTTPFECVQDGKSALRWVRTHAEELGIAPNRIAAGGGSAGGHVAAATGTVPGLNEEGEDTTVSCRPDALVLFNPVYDNGPDGYGHDRVKDRYQEISPMHNLDKQTPATIVFLGTKDHLVPVKTAEAYRDKMKALGIKSELKLYQGEGHGFFNPGKGDSYPQTLVEMDEFLTELGFLKPTDKE